MKHRSHLPSTEREVRSKLAKMAHTHDFLCASIVNMARPCGRPNCKCAAGQLHHSLYLSIRVGGKRRMIYVPTRLEAAVRTAVDNHRALKELVRQLSHMRLEKLFQDKEQRPR